MFNTSRFHPVTILTFELAVGLLVSACKQSKTTDDSNSLTRSGNDWGSLPNINDLSAFRIYGGAQHELARWSTEGDVLNLSPRPAGSKSKADLIITSEPVADFEFSFEWKISPGGNEGVFYKVKDDFSYEKPWHTGLEMQLLDNAGHEEGKIETHRNGDLYDLIASKEDSTLPAGDWNHSRIIQRGNRIGQWMNGKLAVSTEIGSPDWSQIVSTSKYAEWPEYGQINNGHIVLQDHGNQISFRALQIRSL